MNRIEAIKSLINDEKKIADVGCDHGQVGVDLLRLNKVEYVIATDISSKCLEKSNELISMYSLNDSYSGRLGDGLKPINNNEVDTVIIAGMGGDLISQILNADITKTKSFKSFIIQPMTAPDIVRRTMSVLEYRITKDLIVREKDKYYFVIRFDKGQNDIIENDYFFTKTLRRDNGSLLDDYITDEIKAKNNILIHLRSKMTDKSAIRVKEIEKEIIRLEQLYES